MAPIRRLCRSLGEELSEHPVTFQPRPLINRDSKVLTLGSCFALRVKEYLHGAGFNVLNEGDIGPYVTRGRQEFDPRIYYNTYTIRYEFERATGEFVQDADDFWEPYQNNAKVYQDPYRRMLVATDRETLWQRIREVDTQMIEHVQTADLVIITLGLTEVFFQQHNGKAICGAPGYCGGGGYGCEFRHAEYQDNFDNLEKVVQVLQQVNPQANVVLTVSPVPLGGTFATDTDHAVANTESKSTLRAVAGALCRKYPQVHYFHSYEMVMHASREEVFLEDGRHVKPEYVAGVMHEFEKAFMHQDAAGSTGVARGNAATPDAPTGAAAPTNTVKSNPGPVFIKRPTSMPAQTENVLTSQSMVGVQFEGTGNAE